MTVLERPVMAAPIAGRQRITIITDAWHPQINGVVRTLDATVGILRRRGHHVTFITPQSFRNFPCPTYPEIRLSLPRAGEFSDLIEQSEPDFIHISTEGPLGISARRYCLKEGLRFTTAFHTKFPDYVESRFAIPARWTYRFIRWFHGPAEAVMCATPSLERELAEQSIRQTRRWTRGVDTDLFRPDRRAAARNSDLLRGLPRPILLYVGRVAVEKNIEAFLRLDSPGTRLVVGGGPQLARLREKYGDAAFAGPKFGEELAGIYAAADVFVFPSRTDTFGLVVLEALASGAPVAAFPVTGPADIIGEAGWATPVGALHEDLDTAVQQALTLSRDDCRDFALRQSWSRATDQFMANLVPL